MITGTATMQPEHKFLREEGDANRPVMTFSDVQLATTLKRQTPLSALLCGLCEEMFERALLSPTEAFGNETGLVSGAYYGCMGVTQEILATLREKGPRGIDAIEFAKATHSFPLSAVSIAFKLHGPAAAAVSGELASLDALIMACDWLQARRCERVLVVGYEQYSPLLQAHVQHLDARSYFSDSLSIVMLETQRSAHGRGAPILAELSCVVPLSGDQKKVLSQCQQALQRFHIPHNECAIHASSTLHPVAQQLMQQVCEGYSSPHERYPTSPLPQLMGAATVCQLASLAGARPDNIEHWLLHTFTEKGGGMIHLRFAQTAGGNHER